MAYTFRSRSAPGVTLLQVNGDELLRLVGKATSARGVITPEDLPAAIAAIEAAIAPLPPAAAAAAAADEDDGAALITLRQRALPFLDLLRRARDAGEPVTWGIV
jgi:hypothetical protein